MPLLSQSCLPRKSWQMSFSLKARNKGHSFPDPHPCPLQSLSPPPRPCSLKQLTLCSTGSVPVCLSQLPCVSSSCETSLHGASSPGRRGTWSIFSESMNEPWTGSKAPQDAVPSQGWSLNTGPRSGDLRAFPPAARAEGFRVRAGLGVNPAPHLPCSVTLNDLCKLTEPHYLISKMRKRTLIALTS